MSHASNGRSNAKRVLIVGNFLSEHRGIFCACEELAIRLREKGWSVVTTSNISDRAPRLLDMLWTTWRRRKQYDVAQVDVFTGPSFYWAEAVCGILRRLNKPYVLMLRSGGLPEFAEKRRRRVKRLLRSAQHVTAPSTYLQNVMAPYRSSMHTLPNGIDLSNYEFRLRPRPRPHLVWLRAFHANYNPPMVPRVIALLVDEFPDIRVTMYGPDKRLDDSLEAMWRTARELGVADRITAPGAVAKQDVPQQLNTGDVYVNTPIVDNAPVSLVEAMACGLPVVTTNVGGIPHLVEDGKDALLVGSDDAESMAAGVRRILTDSRLAERLSRGARKTAENFGWSNVMPQWESLLTEAAAEG